MARKKAYGGQDAAPASPVDLGPVPRTVKQVLTAAEKVEVGERLGKLYQEFGRAKSAREEALAECKEREKRIDGQISELALVLANGYRWETVDCDLEPDYVAGTMQYVRRDTGEVVGSRALYPIERQATIPQ